MARKKQETVEVEEKPKRGRKKQETVEVEEKPKRGRKKAEAVVEENPKRGRKKVEEVEEKPKRGRKKAEEVVEAEEELFDPYAEINDVIDKIERQSDVNAGTLDVHEKRISTGNLCKDLILLGGLSGGGWYTNFGKEQCAKTTDAVSTLFNLVNLGVPTAALWDYEGSTTPEYQESMLKTNGIKKSVQEMFGLRDPNTGKWIVKPRIRLYQEGIAEKFFDWLANLLRKLPDKKKMGNKWYLIYPFTKENQAMLKGKYDAAYFREFKKFRIPAKDGLPQGIVVVDSYPGMLPEDKDVDDPNGAVGAQARMFADQIKRVKGKLKPKQVIVYGVNQLRLRPMAKGDPEYECGGEALKIFCFNKDTAIFTNRGIVYPKQIGTIKDLEVVGVSGLEKPSVFKEMGVKQLAKVSTDIGMELIGSLDHRVRAVRTGSRKPEWIKLRDLTTDYFVPVKHSMFAYPEEPLSLVYDQVDKKGQGTNQYQVNPEFPTVMTNELARLLGYLVSEGYCKGSRIIFGNTDKEMVDDYLYCLKHVFNLPDEYINRKTKRREGSKKHHLPIDIVDISSTHIGNFLTYCGCNNKSSREKEIPWVILQSTYDHQCEFLRAAFDGDGYISKRCDEISYSSASNKVISQMQLMLLNMGILTNKKVGGDEYLTRNSLSYSLHFYGYDIDLFREHIGSNRACRNARLNARNFESKDGFTRVPKVVHWRNYKLAAVNKLMLGTSEIKSGRYIGSLPTKEDFVEAYKFIKTLRTEQERKANLAFVEELEDFLTYTNDNNLTWVRVTDVNCHQAPEMTYDFNMPETHSVVTNGIVSHNSDCRIKCVSRSLSSVPGAWAKSGMFEEEKSVEGKGKDIYRYVHFRTHKNKLGTPNLETWMRIWVKDRKGKGRGFDPVWECYWYLKETGQITGQRNKIKLNIDGKSPAAKSISWLIFKQMVLGNKDDVATAFEAAGIKDKPYKLREYCFKQFETGKAIELYFAKLQGDVEEDDDEDSVVEED